MNLRNILIPCVALAFSLVGCRQSTPQKTTENDMPSTEISKELSNQFVNTIGEDSLGQIWIGTFRGLNKFDSHEFHHYFASFDGGSIPDDQVKHVMKDSQGRLWIATVDGVSRYTDTDKFEAVKIPNGSRYIREVVETSNGEIFFNNYDGSLMKYQPDS